MTVFGICFLYFGNTVRDFCCFLNEENEPEAKKYQKLIFKSYLCKCNVANNPMFQSMVG